MLKYAYVQPVLKKGNRSNPSNYRPLVLISCLSKTFETILNRKFPRHFSSFNLLSYHQHGFRKGRFTGDLLAFLTDSWSSSLSRFGETFAVALDISKAFHKVWHKALLSKLPSFGLNSAPCSFLSSFLSGRSIAAVLDGHCSTSKPINSGVPQGSAYHPLSSYYSSVIFLWQTVRPMHSYADDTNLHYSTSFDRQPNLMELEISRNDTAERLTSDLSIISVWAEETLFSSISQKFNFFIYQLYKFFHTTIPYSSTTHIVSLTHTNSLGYPLPRNSTGNFTSHFLLNQLPRG